MRPPEFWFLETPNWLARLLAPFSKIWQSQTRKRLLKPGECADLPVISVGNVNLGGVGKTPTVIDLAIKLKDAGFRPVVILRGFGGEEKGPLWVDDQDAKAVGDEALLLAQFAPVIVSRDRAAGAKLARDKGDVILLDDALQNPDLKKDISICVFDAEIGIGNGAVVPSGPLRETIDDARPRMDAAFLIGGKNAALEALLGDVPCFYGLLAPLEMGMNWQGKKLLAFAGIARPKKFFETLRGLGADLVATHEFGDHERIGVAVLERMKREAKDAGAALITTEKDAVRLPKNWQGQILSLPVRLEMKGADLGDWVVEKLKTLR